MEELKAEMTSTNNNMEKLKEELKLITEKCKSAEETLKDRDETIKNNNMGDHFFLTQNITKLSPVTIPTPLLLSVFNLKFSW